MRCDYSWMPWHFLKLYTCISRTMYNIFNCLCKPILYTIKLLKWWFYWRKNYALLEKATISFIWYGSIRIKFGNLGTLFSHRQKKVCQSTPKPPLSGESQYHTQWSLLSKMGRANTTFSRRHERWLITRCDHWRGIKFLSNAFEQSKQTALVLHHRPGCSMGTMCIQN